MNYRLITALFFTTFYASSINCAHIVASQTAFLIPAAITETITRRHTIAHKTIEGFTPHINQWNHGWAIGLEYKFGDNTKNPNGDLNITLGYQICTNNHSSGLKNLSCNIQYENKPGLLGNWGHIQGTVDGSHHDKAVDTFIKIATIEVNTILDYNPEIIARNKKLIAQFKAQQKCDNKKEQEKLENLREKIKEANKANKDNFLRDKQTFLMYKEAFESQPFDENNLQHIRSKKILKELEKIYG